MNPKQAWGAFSIMFVAGDAVAAALLFDLGVEPALVLAGALIAPLVYFYVVYKRYHVEVVPEHDIMEFDDPGDLRILSSIYGLDTKGSDSHVRSRLVAFARVNSDQAFVWIAPRVVQYFGTALEIPAAPDKEPGVPRKSLFKKDLRGSAGASRLGKCPICDSETRGGHTCANCGADLEFYISLEDSKIGRRVISAKAGEVRRKLRYDVPSLRGDR